jgi:predicted ATP-grasp superfamily ATP-dependent carboligase
MITWASDKQLTAERLARNGVAVPTGKALEQGAPLPSTFSYPAVLKPRDGAGSIGVRVIADMGQAAQQSIERASRLEEFCVGQPCSVSLICGNQQATPLPAFTQRLSQDGRFRYLGGERLHDRRLAMRAEQLAMQAAQCFPSEIGYVGVDLVLGPADDGLQDRVIEINPRLTTSYLGLRRLVQGNLAEALLNAAMGQPVRVELVEGPIAFTAGGTVASDFDSLRNVT